MRLMRSALLTVGGLVRGSVGLNRPVSAQYRPGRVAVTCTADGLVHEVSEEAIADGHAMSTGCWRALCGHLVRPAPLVAPAGTECRRCQRLVLPDQVTPSPRRRGGATDE